MKKILLLLVLGAFGALRAEPALDVIKHPSDAILATCVQVDSADPVTPGHERMTLAAFASWKAAELAGGWAPPVSPEPPDPQAIIAAAQAIYDVQELDDQAAFLPVYVAVKDALSRGNVVLAKRTIQIAEVPAGQLETVRQQLLSLFP